jgi:RluA family pseudouridine synthase
MPHQEWIVSSQEEGQKLLFFLGQKFQGVFSARALKRLIDHHACQINGRPERFASTLLGKGSKVSLTWTTSPSTQMLHQVELSRILFQDESLLVYNKPAGINSDEQGITRLLQTYEPSLILVHRLDRETTGALLFAKNQKIFEAFVMQFKQHQVLKQYQALVDGVIPLAKGIIDNQLGKKQQIGGQTYWGSVFQGLPALTEWQKVKSGQEATWVTCWPRTGRTHQLRVHLAEMGHPILGDFHYSKKFCCLYKPARILLHAEQLIFNHPVTNQSIQVKAPLPEDFLKAAKTLFS